MIANNSLIPTVGELRALYALASLNFLVGCIIFSVINLIPNIKCNPQGPWWRNQSINTDLFYVFLNPVFKFLLRFLPVAFVVAPLLLIMPVENIYAYLANGWGPLGKFSIPTQCIIFFVISDFCFYWSHWLFHGRLLWPSHAVHHAPGDVDWTTAYRFHPLNFAFGPWLITTLMVFLGVSPMCLIYIAPIEAAMAFFVHANINVTLGPAKYLIATPVFHRWHHTFDGDAEGKNFGANFSLWDVMFGTFYLPEGQLPSSFGVRDNPVSENYVSQLAYPFSVWLNAFARMIRLKI
jgi:sterol desaturase/sphingolipid hydroxylase (fatty acid hydroxylase superfamily)